MVTDYSLLAEDGEQIPAFLRALKRWLIWRLTLNAGGRPTKVPDQSTLALDRCRTFEEVGKEFPRKKWWSEQGGGFVTTGGIEVKGQHVLFVDLDACRNPATGELSSWAMEAITHLDHSYTEVSPSGKGLRIIVAVAELPKGIKTKVRVEAKPMPGCGDKQPEIQLFGLGPAGYVTLTGLRIKASLAGVAQKMHLDALVKRFAMQETENLNGALTDLQGSGETPDAEAITFVVREHDHGQELIDGEWKKVMPTKSASEAFHLLAQWALEAANGHGLAAQQWLLRHTAWGRGDIDDSADPSRYMRPKWVQADLLRVAKKRTVVTAETAFDALPDDPEIHHKEPEPEPHEAIGDPAAVVDQWAHDGPIIRLPTGLATLDEMTGGGLVLGSRVYLIGAPDAGKTALAVQIADTYLTRGIAVGILGVDEEPVDIATRLMQRRGLSRRDCEERSATTQQAARAALTGVPLRLFDGTVSIERAAAALHEFAKQRTPGDNRPPCVLVVDSIQTARAEKENTDDSLYKSVTARVAQLRRAAAKFRMLVIATSEMNRSAYKSKKVEEQSTDMAAAKESGAIEFSARVLLSLRNVPASSDVVELRVVKNKHGLSHRGDVDGIFLRVDREAQELSEDTEFKPLDTDELKAVSANDRSNDDCARVAELLLEHPAGLGVNEIKAMVKKKLPAERADAARNALAVVGAIVVTAVKRGGKVSRLVLAKVPPEVVERMKLG